VTVDPLVPRNRANSIAAHPDSLKVETAKAHDRQALALAEELSLRPLIAHCYLGLGVLYRRAYGRQQAREHLTIAMTMYREMEMPFWLEETKADTEEVA